jgi:hypothetical protein
VIVPWLCRGNRKRGPYLLGFEVASKGEGGGGTVMEETQRRKLGHMLVGDRKERDPLHSLWIGISYQKVHF